MPDTPAHIFDATEARTTRRKENRMNRTLFLRLKNGASVDYPLSPDNCVYSEHAAYLEVTQWDGPPPRSSEPPRRRTTTSYPYTSLWWWKVIEGNDDPAKSFVGPSDAKYVKLEGPS